MSDPRTEIDGVGVFCRHTDIRDIDSLVPNPRNPNKHPAEQIERLADVISRTGWRQPITISDLSGYIVKGHGRYQAARLAGFKRVPVELQHYASPEEETADLLADNRIAELSELDNEAVAAALTELQKEGDEFVTLAGFDAAELEGEEEEAGDGLDGVANDIDENELPRTAGELAASPYILPPSSVIWTTKGEWQSRKRDWISVGLKSEEGRADSLTFSMSSSIASKKFDKMKKLGRELTPEELEELKKENVLPTTSIFDPVLCEILLSWFSAKGHSVIDPFAGGSVRGIISNALGRRYTGIDLRAEQVAANTAQGEQILPEENQPHWICGDSSEVLPTLGELYDFCLSCPPYADLEKYSDDPRDISNMEYTDFLRVYSSIIRALYDRMKENTFVAWVVGEVRAPSGSYRNFVADTIGAFRAAGFSYYNEIILVNVAGSAPIRAGRVFAGSRKVCKIHQNVLIFVKGDGKLATKACGDVQVANLETIGS